MKKYIYSTIILACLSFFSCNDLLDQTSESKIDSDTMWTSEKTAALGVNSIYQALRSPIVSHTSSTVLTGATTHLGYYSWEAFGMTGQANKPGGGLFTDYEASNIQYEYVWKWCFTGINRASDAIHGVKKAPVSEVQIEQWLAEAKTLRAFFYMRLVELFGRGIGVPIYDEVVTIGTATKPQSPESEVWDFIIKDLNEAIDSPHFANNTIGRGSNSGRASKGLAYALRGKAYLMKSMSLKENHYAQAVTDFNQVETMGYGLFTGGYAQMFQEHNKGNNEMLLVVQNISMPAYLPEDTKNYRAASTESQYGSGVQKYVGPYQAGAKDSNGCWNDFQITPAGVELFEVLVNSSTVEAFDWNNFIPGYKNTSLNDRKTYFLRDTHKGGAVIHKSITDKVNEQLNSISAAKRSEYLPEGNEARIKAAYLNRDPRLEASVITPYSTFKGVNSNRSAEHDYVYRWPTVGGAIYSDGANSESSQVPGMQSSLTSNSPNVLIYMFRKFITEGLELAYRNHSPVDEPILRYADVLLMKAEALVELNQVSTARTVVEQVRTRAGMPTMSQSFASQEAARNYVRDERRREFIGEGVNFFDEMRWKTLQQTKYEYGTQTAMQVTGATAPGPTYRWNNARYTWPVPKKEIEINSNLKRTPGWTY